MNKKYICDYNQNGALILYTTDINGKAAIITHDIKNIIHNIENFLTHEFIIKLDINNEKIILQEINKNILLIFNNCNKLLEESSLISIKNFLLDKISQEGYINISNVQSLNKTPKKENKHTNSIIKKVAPIVISIAMVITSISYFANHKTKDNNINQTVQIEQSIKKEPHNLSNTIGIGNITNFNSLSKQFLNISEKDNDAKINLLTQNYNIDNTKNNFITLSNSSINQQDNQSIAEEQIEENTIDESTIENTEENIIQVNVPFDDLSNSEKAITTKGNYYSIIEKYSKKYGLDPNLILSIATQERGVHASVIDSGGAIGLMQIQYSVWINQSIDYYELNEETNLFEYHTIENITDEMLENLETNIQLGCMIFQSCLRSSNYNIPLAIQMYNMGLGTIYDILDNYAYATGKTRSEIMNNPSDLGWLEYRPENFGDKHYLENVNKWADSNKFTVTDVTTGEEISIEFTNEQEEARKAR